METLTSDARPASPEFQANEKAQLAAVADLRERLATAALGGSVASRERHIGRGKLLPRDRIDHLLDRGSPFLEVAPLAANGMYDDEVPGAGVIDGLGVVQGLQVMSVCNEAAV